MDKYKYTMAVNLCHNRRYLVRKGRGSGVVSADTLYRVCGKAVNGK